MRNNITLKIFITLLVVIGLIVGYVYYVKDKENQQKIITKKAVSPVVSGFDKTKNHFKDTVNKVKNVVTKIVDVVKAVFGIKPDGTKVDSVKDYFINLFTQVKGLALSPLQLIMSVLKLVGSVFVDTIGGVFKTIINYVMLALGNEIIYCEDPELCKPIGGGGGGGGNGGDDDDLPSCGTIFLNQCYDTVTQRDSSKENTERAGYLCQIQKIGDNYCHFCAEIINEPECKPDKIIVD